MAMNYGVQCMERRQWLWQGIMYAIIHEFANFQFEEVIKS